MIIVTAAEKKYFTSVQTDSMTISSEMLKSIHWMVFRAGAVFAGETYPRYAGAVQARRQSPGAAAGIFFRRLSSRFRASSRVSSRLAKWKRIK